MQAIRENNFHAFGFFVITFTDVGLLLFQNLAFVYHQVNLSCHCFSCLAGRVLILESRPMKITPNIRLTNHGDDVIFHQKTMSLSASLPKNDFTFNSCLWLLNQVLNTP